MKVKELMSKSLVTIDVDRSLRDARKMMEKESISRLLVTDEKRVIGMITERDLSNRLGDWRERKMPDSHIHVSAVCKYQLIMINENAELSSAADMMLKFGISSLVVVDGNPIGLVTKTDLVKSLKDSRALVKGYMSKPVIALEMGSRLLEARNVMIKKRIKRIPITLDGEVVGIITESDMAKALGMFRKVAEGKHWDERMRKISVDDVMSRDIACLKERDTLGDCVDIMLEKDISGLPVLEDGKLVGIITKTDLVRAVRNLGR